MPPTKATQRRKQLRQLLRVARFQSWPEDRLTDEIEALFAPAKRSGAKRTQS